MTLTMNEQFSVKSGENVLNETSINSDSLMGLKTINEQIENKERIKLFLGLSILFVFFLFLLCVLVTRGLK